MAQLSTDDKLDAIPTCINGYLPDGVQTFCKITRRRCYATPLDCPILPTGISPATQDALARIKHHLQ